MVKTSRRLHQWLMVVVGIQFLFWSLTGLYMVSVDIHAIHGETLVKPKMDTLELSELHISLAQLLSRYPNAVDITLKPQLNQPVYLFRDGLSAPHVTRVSARTGLQLDLLQQAEAEQIARYAFLASAPIASVNLLNRAEQVPSELSARHLPVWQIEFDQLAAPTFYISQHSGEIVTKRHLGWRLFDWFWRFHIMEYRDGEQVQNQLLIITAFLALLAALTGAVLTYQRAIKAELKRRLR